MAGEARPAKYSPKIAMHQGTPIHHSTSLLRSVTRMSGRDGVEHALAGLQFRGEQRQRMRRCDHAASPRASDAAWRIAAMLAR